MEMINVGACAMCIAIPFEHSYSGSVIYRKTQFELLGHYLTPMMAPRNRTVWGVHV